MKILEVGGYHDLCGKAYDKIRCPKHYVLKPDGIPFVMERIPSLRHIKEADARQFGIKLWRRKKDKFGRYIQNWKDYLQPPISRAFAREGMYKFDDPICNKCRRCIIK